MAQNGSAQAMSKLNQGKLIAVKSEVKSYAKSRIAQRNGSPNWEEKLTVCCRRCKGPSNVLIADPARRTKMEGLQYYNLSSGWLAPAKSYWRSGCQSFRVT